MDRPDEREAPGTAKPPESSSDSGPEPGRESGGNRARDKVVRDLVGGPAGPDNTAPSGQGEPPDQASGQASDRQRVTPQDRRRADVIDRENIAGDRDFELEPPAK